MNTGKHLLFSFLIILSVGAWGNILSANELTPPEQYVRIAPDFLDAPIKSSFELPSIKLIFDLSEIDTKKISVKRVQLKGNTALNRNLIKPIIKPVLDKLVTINQLEQVRYEISKLYYELGYINSGVVLPKQSFENGLIVFVAIEGTLSDVNISGSSTLNSDQMKNKLIHGAGTPLNINTLQTTLDQINAAPSVDRLHASLIPGSSLGKSILNIEIEEADQYNVIMGFDNYRSPAVGAERGFLTYQHHSVTGHSDSVVIQAGLTKGVTDYSFRYDVPLPQYNSWLSSYYVKSDSQFVEDDLASLNISNKASIYGVNWNYSFVKKNIYSRELGVGVELLKNRNSLLGTDKENVVVVSNQTQFSGFLNRAIDTTINTIIRTGKTSSEFSQASSDFTLLKIETHSLKKIPPSKSFIQIKSSSQFNSKPLLGLEKLSIGGAHTVRGYRENTLVKDNGLILNVEYSVRLNQPSLTATVFTDIATGWNHNVSDSNEQLFSFGAGLNWNNHKSINIDSFVGLPLMNKSTKSDNLQDFGIHFGVQYQL